MRSAPAQLVAGLVAAVIAVGLAGCSHVDQSTVTGTPDSTSSASADPATGSASPSPATSSTPEPSTSLSPQAESAYGRFDAANKKLAGSNADATDDQIVGALTAAGFAKSALQITPDQTTIGRRVDSIEVSALVGRTCLIGEYRGSAYTSITAPVLETGKCLVGTTATIN